MSMRAKKIDKIDEEIMRLEEMIKKWKEERSSILYGCPVCGHIVHLGGLLYVVDDESERDSVYYHLDCYQKNEPMIRLHQEQKQRGEALND